MAVFLPSKSAVDPLTHCSREISEALSPMYQPEYLDKTPDSKWFHVTIANGSILA